jgi:GNAT superfamily N-acetyltransferase
MFFHKKSAVPHLEDEEPPKVIIQPCLDVQHQEMIDLLLRRYKDVSVKLDLEGLNKDLTDLNWYWRKPGGEFMVLVVDGKVVGCLGARPLPERGRAEFNYFYLDPAFEGKGTSAPLYRWALEWCVRHDIEFVEIWSGQARTRAHHLYRNLGFVHTGVKRLTQRAPEYYALHFELHVTDELLKNLKKRFDRLP